jgi:tetratricopeptide (TPR) repeat protein
MLNEIKTIYEIFNKTQFSKTIDLSNKILRNNRRKLNDDQLYQIYNLRGLSYFRLKKYYLSKINYIKSLKINKNKDVLYNYAVLLISKKDFDISLHTLGQLIELDDQNFSYYALLFQIKNLINFSDRKKFDNLFSRSASINIKNHKVIDVINFVNFLSKNNELDISKLMCEKLLSLNNHNIFFLYSLIQKKLSNYTLSLNYMLKAVELNDSNYLYFHELGSLYEVMGDFKKAVSCFRKSLQFNTNFGSTYRSLSDLGALNENDISILLKKISLNSNDDNFLMHVYFALSKYYFNKKNPDQCHYFYTRANEIRNKTLRLDLNIVKNYKNNFSKLLPNLLKNKKFRIKKDYNIKPIFIIGMPRSGSTLIEQILGSHSQIDSYGEVNFLFNSIDKYLPLNQIYLNENNINNLDEDIIVNISDYYLKQFHIKQNDTQFVTDKMLFNYLFIDLIKILFPSAKIVFCFRDFRDIFMSIIRNYFGDKNFNFAYNKNELLNYINFFSEHMKICLKKYDDILFVNYESLILQFEKEVTTLIKKLDLSIEDSCLNFQQNSKTVNTASSFQVRQKIYDSSVNLWQSYKKFYKEEFDKLEILNKSFF